MAKIYFVTGHIASGHRQLAGDLVDVLRSHYDNDKIFCQDFGKDNNIADYGSTPPDAILFEISNMLSYHDHIEVFVFTGWQLLENIQAIYDQYKDTATFIVVKARTPETIKLFSRQKLRNITSSTISASLATELTAIDSFFTNNSLTADWMIVGDPIFNSDLSVNVTETPSTISNMITVLGTM